jgi:hypothetical protein
MAGTKATPLSFSVWFLLLAPLSLAGVRHRSRHHPGDGRNRRRNTDAHVVGRNFGTHPKVYTGASTGAFDPLTVRSSDNGRIDATVTGGVTVCLYYFVRVWSGEPEL